MECNQRQSSSTHFVILKGGYISKMVISTTEFVKPLTWMILYKKNPKYQNTTQKES